MEILFAFLGGLCLTSVVAFFVARSVVKNRVSAVEQSVAVKAEAAYKVEQTRLQSELEYAKSRIGELQSYLDASKIETERLVKVAKDEAAEALQPGKRRCCAFVGRNQG